MLKRDLPLFDVECKLTNAHDAFDSIGTRGSWIGKACVLYPGTRPCPIKDRVETIPLAQLAAPGGLSAYFP